MNWLTFVLGVIYRTVSLFQIMVKSLRGFTCG